MKIKISTIESSSLVNGPGVRAVIWTQGCYIGRTSPCKGCFNANTWTLDGGKEVDTVDIAKELNSLDIRGVTFSGGDPLDQVEEVIDIIKHLDRKLDTMIFTGWEIEEVVNSINKKKILEYVDLLKTGRYKPEFHSNDTPWRGSSNQRLHYLTNRISPDEESSSTRVEINVKNDGKIKMTGFPSKELISEVKKI